LHRLTARQGFDGAARDSLNLHEARIYDLEATSSSAEMAVWGGIFVRTMRCEKIFLTT
jgi:hypothetical protein